MALRSVASITQVIFGKKCSKQLGNPASLLHAHVTEKRGPEVFCQRCLEELFSHKHFKIANLSPESAFSTQPSLFSTRCDYIDLRPRGFSMTLPNRNISSLEPISFPSCGNLLTACCSVSFPSVAKPDPGLTSPG